ncbi:MAG: Tryptophan synthase alpha chain [Polyangiaceae bacterium]|nr:Tryptophan synthase alpha chain [Polyangiaceae bacterium]
MQRHNISASLQWTAVFSLAASLAWACSPASSDSKIGSGEGNAGSSAAGGSSGVGAAGSLGLDIAGSSPSGGPSGPCKGLECQVPTCSGGADTTISGKVYDPAGKMPLYNVVVYVPNGPVPAFTDGASCDRCGASITNPVTAAVTDETGSFKLSKVPAGSSIPLVIQVGKWRRQLVVPSVAECVDTALTDPQLTRLPRNKAEGDIPRIAIAAGGADAMECLPRRLGIDDAEHTTSAGDGRIHLFTATDNGGDLSVKAFDASLNGGAALPHSQELWRDLATLKKYDIVMLSCEGTAFMNEKPMPSRQAMYDYASQGGRVFASHWSHVWFSAGPDPLPTTGQWMSRNNPADAATALPATINQTFPKGEAMAKWLVNVGASTTQGTLNVVGPRDDIQMVNPMSSREWITLDNPNYPQAPKVVEYMSFNTPLGVPEGEACGRTIFTGLHVSSNVEDRVVQPPGFPRECEATELSAQEKAVAFMLFDLSACIQNDSEPPKPPK